MSHAGSCPRCGRPLPGDAPCETCPDCTLEAAPVGRPGSVGADPPAEDACTLLPEDEPSPGGGPSGPIGPEGGTMPAGETLLTSPHPVAAPSGPETFVVPEVPGHEVREPLGRGGMGIVFRAVQRALKREVALKMLRTDLHVAPERLAR